MGLAELSRGMMVALCALSLLFCQQLCDAQALISESSHKSDHSHANHSHDHNKPHQHNSGSDDGCCKNQAPLGLTQHKALITQKIVPSLTPIFLQLVALDFVGDTSTAILIPAMHHPPDLASRAPPLSISLSPNAPPSISSI